MSKCIWYNRECEIEGDYPKYGNDDDKVDCIAVELVEKFIFAVPY